jgi:hypothetical protein
MKSIRKERTTGEIRLGHNFALETLPMMHSLAYVLMTFGLCSMLNSDDASFPVECCHSTDHK